MVGGTGDRINHYPSSNYPLRTTALPFKEEIFSQPRPTEAYLPSACEQDCTSGVRLLRHAKEKSKTSVGLGYPLYHGIVPVSLCDYERDPRA
ncbi:hypothetical protein RRG08_031708 [Elysia crispata]|uniref:Uncharacterized protein n=1 Tax=Elysia crispata TaxID=231223 RepID=A0AAE0ZEZ7_9GAST|nr:hypothetical protein RRG08_031708 [Elysia crispata]